MKRRTYLRSAGVGAAALLAGCSAEPTGTDTQTATDGSTDTQTGTTTGTTEGTPTLRVGTYASFIDAPSTSPGAWVKEQFESEHDANLEWFAPEGGIDYFLQRRNQGVTVDTDLFAGLTPENMVRADDNLQSGESLFDAVNTDNIANADHLIEDYQFDPQGRALPMGASYISLVYNQNMLDERGVGAPQSFEDLVSDDYSDALLIPNPQNSETGLEFLFWTINEYGEDGYLDYWQRLLDNGARILEGWGAAYGAYSEGEAPAVVSYSTDQVFADQSGADMAEHQIGFLNGEGYAYLEAMARFSGTDKPELAESFISFMLRPEIQAEIAQRNVALPAVDNADLPQKFDDLTPEPETVVSFDYDRLSGNVDTWLDEWSRQVASQ
ncbi:thiamine ABC transporter substrate-binding protein [Halolamina salifodinae]|uniref:Thiamine transport system substrate-binding protein n=1 Tax=Halolamina salifodinae TaxID=1202767 RepID=A0A8T4GRT8_9EURY|nr:thiamine ABC transporter substrate-binding protein [Halolamina salifodinae]MBP1985861.1 thiamine transport system substrate-binding protein [Halolamina salifodinae]